MECSSWTETGDINTARYNGGSAGTYTAALIFGGSNQAGTQDAETEAWNGTSWTELADLATARNYQHGSGAANTDAIYAGGSTPSVVAATEEWAAAPVTAAILEEGMIFLSGGTSLKGFGRAAGIPAATWASGGTMNTARDQLAAAGNSVSTSTLVFGGDTTPHVANTEQYNGSSWTEVNDMNTARYTLGSGTLSYTEGFCVGGWLIPGVSSAVEAFDGTNWTEVAEMNTARNGPFLSGDSSNAICSGGSVEPGVQTKAELWNVLHGLKLEILIQQDIMEAQQVHTLPH